MKNSSKTSRRSFLKQSSLGVVVAAGSGFFANLASHATYQGPEGAQCLKSKTMSFYSAGDGYDTEESALTDAINAYTDWVDNMNESYWNYEWKERSIYSPCILKDPVEQFATPNPAPVITHDEATGNYSYVMQYQQGFIYC